MYQVSLAVDREDCTQMSPENEAVEEVLPGCEETAWKQRTPVNGPYYVTFAEESWMLFWFHC